MKNVIKIGQCFINFTKLFITLTEFFFAGCLTVALMVRLSSVCNECIVAKR